MSEDSDSEGISIEEAEMPGNGGSLFYFPDPQRGHGKADIVFRIRTGAGSTWYAAVPQRDRHWTRHRAFVMPDKASVYVDGHVVPADSPKDWRHIGLETVNDCAWTPIGDHIVFLGLHGLAAYGRRGLCWVLRCNHFYLRRIIAIDGNRIRVEGWKDEDAAEEFPDAFSLVDGSAIYD